MNDHEKVEIIMEGKPEIPEECWIFPGASIREGKTMIWFDGRKQIQSRLVWSLHNGTIPDNHVIRMECGDPRCYNTEHMRMVTTEVFQMERFEEFRPVYEERISPSPYTYFYNLAFLQDSNDDKISYHGLRLTLEEFTSRWIPGRGITSGIFTYNPLEEETYV